MRVMRSEAFQICEYDPSIFASTFFVNINDIIELSVCLSVCDDIKYLVLDVLLLYRTEVNGT